MLEIKTERLTLRPLEMSDLFTSFAYAGNPENAQYMMFLPKDSINEVEDWLSKVVEEWKKEKPEYYEFAIILDGKHIGGIDLEINELKGEGELGWIVHKDYWGKGYAAEAAKAIIDFAKNTVGLNRLIAHCDARNAGSYKLMEKIGMMLETSDGKRMNRLAKEESQELMYSMTI